VAGAPGRRLDRLALGAGGLRRLVVEVACVALCLGGGDWRGRPGDPFCFSTVDGAVN